MSCAQFATSSQVATSIDQIGMQGMLDRREGGGRGCAWFATQYNQAASLDQIGMQGMLDRRKGGGGKGLCIVRNTIQPSGIP